MQANKTKEALFDGVLLAICFVLGTIAYVVGYFASVALGNPQTAALWQGAGLMVIVVILARVTVPGVLSRSRLFQPLESGAVSRSRPSTLTAQTHRG
jgi:hypothetical protein